jgi:hypothetical protein
LSNDMTVLACSRLLVRFTRLLKNEVGATPDAATCALSKTTGATAIKSGADPVQVCASDSEQRPRGGTPEREPVQRRVRWATPMADAGEGVLGWLCRGLLWERNACRVRYMAGALRLPRAGSMLEVSNILPAGMGSHSCLQERA